MIFSKSATMAKTHVFTVTVAAVMLSAPCAGYTINAARARGGMRRCARRAAEPCMDGKAELADFGLGVGQKYGPTAPAHPMEKPWSNVLTQEGVQIVKAASNDLRDPLVSDMVNEEIFVSKDSIHILKHHGSYMQQNRDLKKKAEREKSYQFMLRLKVPCGEVPGPLFRELDELSNKYGQGDLRATTRQAFQLHGVLKGDLKAVISTIANVGSHTYGGCGDINRNLMTPAVHFPNNAAYMYCQKYSKALADLFKPMSSAFNEIWLDGEKAATVEYWQKDIEEFKLDEVRTYDNGNGIITGHPVEPIYGRTYLPKKFKIAMTVPGDNSVDLYINDIGCVVIMEADGSTLKGFNIVVGGGMGRTHRKEATFARAADHLGFVKKDDFFEAMKAIIATQRDHGNREVRSSARLKYLVHTLGINDFRSLVEQYLGKPIEPWVPLPAWKYLDWMGWHDQGDGKLMLGINVEQGRVRDTPELRIKTCLRTLVDNYGVDLLLTPSQSIVLRNIEPAHKYNVEAVLREHGVKLIHEVDAITRKSIACPSFPLCGLAMAEAERVQPQINARLNAKLREMGMANDDFVTRTTGCPNGCARPYMAEIAFVGSGPNTYQLWLGGSPAQAERTGQATSIFKMKFDDLEKTVEPIFAMWKSQRNAPDEALGDFCHRVSIATVEEFMETYELGSFKTMPSPFAPAALPTPDSSIGISAQVLAKLQEEASARDMDAASLLEMIVSEALEG
jgi:sulfite reductase (ferredoxin)